MSHSDSEVREDLKRKIHKKLHVAMKAKNKMGNTKEFLTSWSNNRPAQAHIKSILQEIKLMEAVNTNNTDRLQSLLESGVDPNTTDGEMRSALHVAASKGYQDCVKLLLHYGADPNIRDSVRNTPLHLAACVHSLPVISMLINANADVTCLDIHGRNPLHLVSSKLQILQKGWREGAIEMVKLKFELQQVIDLLMSLCAKSLSQRMQEALNMSSASQTKVEHLQLMNLSLNSKPAEQMDDDQITKLLDDLQTFQIE